MIGSYSRDPSRRIRNGQQEGEEFETANAIGGDLWAVFNRPSKRLLAAVTALSPIASIVSTYFSLPPIRFGSIVIGRLAFTILISGFVIAAILARRTWKTWRQGVELGIEFNAAREVQQQLVPPPPLTSLASKSRASMHLLSRSAAISSVSCLRKTAPCWLWSAT